MADIARSLPKGQNDRRVRRELVAARRQRWYEQPSSLPPTEQLLLEGGDLRLALDENGVNKYGCQAYPDPEIAAFGSSTASIISETAFSAAEHLRRRLMESERLERRSITYSRETARLRGELLALCGVPETTGTGLMLAASGTDIHLIAAQMIAGDDPSSLRVIMVEAAETGSGVAAALGGRHFSSRTALGEPVTEGEPIVAGRTLDVAAVALRQGDGTLRPERDILADIASLVECAAAESKRVLLTVVDVSKTGLIAPRLRDALALRARFPETVHLLIDACQFRLAPATLRAYLDHDCYIALTGSKFVTGPAFSGALLVPPSMAGAERGPLALSPAPPNLGLLLRWEAALAELRAFRTVPEPDVTAFLASFARAVRTRLASDPTFEPVDVPALDRRPLIDACGWDHIQTIFPFLLRDASGAHLSRAATQRIYSLLGTATDGDGLRCQLGQPVSCGIRSGKPVSGLRICASARLAVAGARSRAAREDVTDQALAVLDKTAALARQILSL